MLIGGVLGVAPHLSGPLSAQWTFVRGDLSNDGVVDVTDASLGFEQLIFDSTVDCLDALDVNDDGSTNIADPIFLLTHLFASGPVPSAPFPDCGSDPTPDALDCHRPSLECPFEEPPGSPFPGLRYSMGGFVSSIEIADLDGDGHLDLVSSNGGNERLRWGRGDGTFSLGHIPVATATTTRSADFDSDGVLDLVSSSRELFLGQPDGTFVEWTLHWGVDATRLHLGDFDDDGHTDLLLVEFPTAIHVLLGNGDATFSAAITTPLPSGQVLDGAPGDFDGDGQLDLVVATTTEFRFLPGSGDGTFGSGTSFGSGVLSILFDGMHVADFDDDGSPDIAITDSPSLDIFLGDGSGGFTLAQSLGPADGVSTTTLTSGDLNGDGVRDLATCHFPSSSVTPLIGNGDGTFTPGTTTAAAAGCLSIEMADLDEDGAVDVVVGMQGTGDVMILRGLGDGTLEGPISSPSVPSDFWEPHDLDLDGVLDLVDLRLDYVQVRRGDGSGGFGPTSVLPVGEDPRSFVVIDLDGDTIPDLATANAVSGDVSVLRGNGDGTFTAAVPWPAGGASIVSADFDADGWNDLAVLGPAGISILIGTLGGSFAPPDVIPAGGETLSVGDYDADGIPDLSTRGSGLIEVFLGSGTGTFIPAGTYDIDTAMTDWTTGREHFGPFTVLRTRTPTLRVPALVDFNGDGVTDRLSGGNSRVRVEMLRVDGSVDRALEFGSGDVTIGGPFLLTPGDFDGDGRLDILVQESTLNILLNRW